ESNLERILGVPNRTPYVKDGIGRRVVDGEAGAVNPALEGTKAAAHYRLEVEPGASAEVRLRLLEPQPGPTPSTDALAALLGAEFEVVFEDRRREADAFYAAVIPSSLGEDEARVMRQALAGMLWSKQFYYYDVDRWLGERGSDP